MIRLNKKNPEMDFGYNTEGHWIKVALLSFLIAALLGLSLRIGFITGFPDWIHYRYVLHAHSHVAMLGWLYSAYFIVIIYLFKLRKNRYKNLFWLIQLSVLGMLIFFPIQGYGLWSILFTTIHLLTSYVFMWRVNKDLTKVNVEKDRYAILFLKTAFLFFFISTLGVWILGPLMNSEWKGTAVYYAAIQFFLHFQFNGWFIFGMLGLFLKFLSDADVTYNSQNLKVSYWLLLVSCILTYALAVSWSTPDKLIFWTNSTGVIIQLIALFYLIKVIWEIYPKLTPNLKKWTNFAWTISFLGLFFKIGIQGFVAIPVLAKISYTIHNFVIGFIHLILLGIISFFVLGFFHQSKLFEINSNGKKIGILLIFTGIIGSELVLFGQGVLLWIEYGFLQNYYIIIAVISGFIPLGILFYLLLPNKQTAFLHSESSLEASNAKE
jgi:hypothetical protein